MSGGHDHGHGEHEDHGHGSHDHAEGAHDAHDSHGAPDLKNMTPEQIRALQKQNCIFCHIIAGRVAAKKVYEDEHVVAILDINPLNPGHILLLPREHYQIMPQIPEDMLNHLMSKAKALSHSVLRALQVKGTNIFIANGAAAGQRAPHFMVHIIPRAEGDNITTFKLPKSKIGEEDTETIFHHLKTKVNKAFGIKEEIVTGKEGKEKAHHHTEEEKHDKHHKKHSPQTHEEKHEVHKEHSPHKEIEHPDQEKEEADLDKITSLFTPHAKEEKKGVSLDKIANLFK